MMHICFSLPAWSVGGASTVQRIFAFPRGARENLHTSYISSSSCSSSSSSSSRFSSSTSFTAAVSASVFYDTWGLLLHRHRDQKEGGSERWGSRECIICFSHPISRFLNIQTVFLPLLLLLRCLKQESASVFYPLPPSPAPSFLPLRCDTFLHPPPLFFLLSGPFVRISARHSGSH